MLFKQATKIVGTLSVLVFLLLNNAFAQKLTQNKIDSTTSTAETVAIAKSVPQAKMDTLAKNVTSVLATETPTLIKKDSVLKAAPVLVEDDKNIFKVVEEQPEFNGGLAAFFKYLNASVTTPPEALKERIEGRVTVSFVVNVDSTVSNVTVSRTALIKRTNDDKTVEADVEKDKIAIDALKTEAIRVIKAMPKWKPGKQEGKIVRSLFAMPVSF
jgi:hypothetical protein